MLQAGILADYATDWLGAENLRRFAVRFAGIVWPGDTLTCTGRIVDQHDEGERRLVEVELTCTREGEEDPVLTGSASFELEPEEAAGA